MTGYLLYQLTGDKDYREFADAEASLPKAEVLDPAAAQATTEEKFTALLK